MPAEEKERSRYYQEIAAAFFKQRGGPFLLSPWDMATIQAWESMGVPLEAAREGIDKAFEYRRTVAPARGRIRHLAACNSQVLKAFERGRERRVGAEARVATRAEKKARIEAEARRFLGESPGAVSFLKGPFERALAILASDAPDEEALEGLEDEVEKLLVERAPEAERAEARRAIAREFPKLHGRETAEVLALKLVKTLRLKYKIPHLTFPYY
jgi:hypothetical protein